MVESRANARTDLEVFVDCSMIENQTNERCGDEMESERLGYDGSEVLCWTTGYRLLMISNDDRWIWLVEVMVFQVDDRADKRELAWAKR